MLNFAERYIIFRLQTEIKVYDTITNTLKSPLVSNRRIEKYIYGEVDGSSCVAGMSIYCYVNPESYGSRNKLVRINAQKLVEDNCRSERYFHYWEKIDLNGQDVFGVENDALMVAPNSSELIILGGKSKEHEFGPTCRVIRINLRYS